MKRFKELLGSAIDRFNTASKWLSGLGTVQKVVILFVLLSACAFAFKFVTYIAAPAANGVNDLRMGLQEFALGSPGATVVMISVLSVVLHLLYRRVAKSAQVGSSPWQKLFSNNFVVTHGSRRELALNLVAAALLISATIAATWGVVRLIELGLVGIAVACEAIWEADWPIVALFALIAGSYLFAAFRPQEKPTAETTEEQQTQPGAAQPDNSSATSQPAGTVTVPQSGSAASTPSGPTTPAS